MDEIVTVDEHKNENISDLAPSQLSSTAAV